MTVKPLSTVEIGTLRLLRPWKVSAQSQYFCANHGIESGWSQTCNLRAIRTRGVRSASCLLGIGFHDSPISPLSVSCPVFDWFWWHLRCPVPSHVSGRESRQRHSVSAGRALIILQLADRGVPDLSLVRELRTHADTRGMPLITLTRFDDAYTREQIVRAGGSAILIDPVKAPLLLRQLRRLLARTPGAAAVSPGTEKLTVMPAP